MNKLDKYILLTFSLLALVYVHQSFLFLFYGTYMVDVCTAVFGAGILEALICGAIKMSTDKNEKDIKVMAEKKALEEMAKKEAGK